MMLISSETTLNYERGGQWYERRGQKFVNGMGIERAGRKEKENMSEEVKTNAAPVGEGNDVAGDADAAKSTEGEKKSFNEILGDKEYQKEYDRRVSKAIETAKITWEKDLEAKVNGRVAEAAKLAKMSADEKAKYKNEQREADLAKRESAIVKRELMAEAKEQLADEGLPKELADTLDYTDAESCKKSLESVKKIFAAALEKAVNGKLKGNAPHSAAKMPDYDSMSDDEYYKTKLKKQ